MENEQSRSQVAIPREVAEAIEELRAEGVSNYRIMLRAEGAVFTESDLALKRWAFDEDGSGTTDMLMGALINGYTVKRTAAEQLRELYRSHKDSIYVEDGKVAVGIKQTIEILREEYPELVDEDHFADILDPHRPCPDCGEDCAGWIVAGERCGRK